MKLYFVRHGQTDSNVNRVYQGKDELLSARGKEEALFLAQRLKKIPLDAIISSPAQRTQDTASFIAKDHNLPIETVEILKERVWPKKFIGQSKNDPELKKIRKLLDEKAYTEPSWHYSDEESFDDIKRRALEAKNYFESLSSKYQHVAAITHVRFLKLFLLTLLYGDTVTAEIFYPFFENVSINNTSLTVCEYIPELGEKNRWHILTINDHVHLGEHQRQLPG